MLAGANFLSGHTAATTGPLIRFRINPLSPLGTARRMLPQLSDSELQLCSMTMSDLPSERRSVSMGRQQFYLSRLKAWLLVTP